MTALQKFLKQIVLKQVEGSVYLVPAICDFQIDEALEEERKQGQNLPIQIVSDCFSFARYLNENFHYFDNTDVGDVYKDNDGQELYSEKDIYDEWLNNR